MKSTNEYRKRLDEAYALWLVAREGERIGRFANIYPLFPGMRRASVRRMIYDHHREQGGKLPGPEPRNVGDPEPEIDADAVWELAVKMSQKALMPRCRRIAFEHGPVALVFSADWHLGSEGTDYARLDRELQIINDTPGMYHFVVGDLLDNFIIGRLKSIRFNGAPFRVSEEWALVKRALGIAAPKLLGCVSGNHDNWTYMLAGIDYLEDVVRGIKDDMMYARDELNFVLEVGDREYRIRARHQWHGTSQYNATHGIEKASKFDKGVYFDVGVGAHTHRSGLSREFNNGGQTGIAVLCGSYKRVDTFATQIGFPQANEATAVAVVFDEEGVQFGSSNLEGVAAYMTALWGE